ncbi:glycoside hydrolase family 2 protein [Tautonia plasticadhaerens]|uniref:Beta-galactosidase n=1 Tax=Tautonia plasticadhaerens TaxID=2527974 RepID=A0A518H9S7_9BACT|nr:sugar-binding domain-containing protein [Tautonia plasticadhaerens]QDV37612.1 Beta-galactosidase [Tautonia plasticadhaerens]
MHPSLIRSAWLGLAILSAAAESPADWEPAEAPLMTRWASDVGPDSALPEYPRPQMVRERWQNLNGLWQYAIRPGSEPRPERFDGEILVPYPVESALSGVMKRVSPDEALWYLSSFTLPEGWSGDRVLLHFGAADWEARVWVNGELAGEHRGGYDPFSFEVTPLLRAGENELVVRVWDPTDRGYQPRGKQVLQPESIWYTPVTGLWQTVWLEPVAEEFIGSLRIEPDLDSSSVLVHVDASEEGTVRVEAKDGDRVVGQGEGRVGRPVTIAMEDVTPWSPDNPHLYDLAVTLERDGRPVDRVASYFGMRKIELKADDQGVNRLFLNDEPLFQYGPLDQGWWPDGLYTAPTDEALKYDVEVTKRLGFNMTRKHVKVEPSRWYYWCDKLGLLVWQDMPSGDAHPDWVREVDEEGPELRRSAESAQDFRVELEALVTDFFNHPSIVVWVPFNERWGQSDTAEAVAQIRRLDPTRLVNSASGGNFLGVGDILDVHSYPDPSMPRLDPSMAVVCGEFGGLGLPLEGNTWLDKGNWGYRTFETAEALTEAYLEKLEMLRPMIGRGLAAAVYTQITDVEIEVNGLLTYDRAVIKIDPDTLAEANRSLYEPGSQAGGD